MAKKKDNVFQKYLFPIVLVFLAAFFGTILAIVNWTIIKKYFLAIIKNPLSGWITLILLVLVLVLIKAKKKSPGIFFLTPEVPPDHKIKNATDKKISIIGVNWLFWWGNDGLPYSNPRLWVDGPFCPNCDYELDKERGRWICVNCGGKFKIPKNFLSDTRKKIIKIGEVQIRTQKEKSN